PGARRLGRGCPAPRDPPRRQRRRSARASLRGRRGLRVRAACPDARRDGPGGYRVGVRARPGRRQTGRPRCARLRRGARPMIVPSPNLSPGHAAAYYLDDYTRGDYHAAGGAVVTGTWQGRGAERLGLTRGSAAVEREDFAALLEGRSPIDGSQLVAAQSGTGRHCAGWDFPVAPHKTVSLAALVGPDPRIVTAHLAAAARAFEVLEQ